MVRVLFRFVLLGIAILVADASFSQDITVRSNSTVVLVPTLVTDSAGKPVFGLRADDFVVIDNGAVQQVRIDDTLESQPISLVIAVETGQDAKDALEKIQHLGTLIDPIIGDGKGEAALVTFASEAKLVQNFTSESDAITKALKTTTAHGGGAAILDAIAYSSKLLASRPKTHRKILLLISETRDDGSSTRVEDVVRELEASNTLVYTSSYSPVLDSLWKEPTSNTPNFLNLFKILVNEVKENVPQTVAQLSGGEYMPFKSEMVFEDKMAQIANHVFNLYLLSFQPKNLQPGQHSLKVGLRFSSDGRIYARRGYWAAEQGQASTAGPMQGQAGNAR